MHVELVGKVAAVVVPVAGDHGHNAGAARTGDGGDLEEVLLLVLALQVRQQPGRLGQADDQVVLRAHLLGDGREIIHLG